MHYRCFDGLIALAGFLMTSQPGLTQENESSSREFLAREMQAHFHQLEGEISNSFDEYRLSVRQGFENEMGRLEQELQQLERQMAGQLQSILEALKARERELLDELTAAGDEEAVLETRKSIDGRLAELAERIAELKAAGERFEAGSAAMED